MVLSVEGFDRVTWGAERGGPLRAGSKSLTGKVWSYGVVKVLSADFLKGMVYRRIIL